MSGILIGSSGVTGTEGAMGGVGTTNSLVLISLATESGIEGI
jgi:hypothetical protein